MELLEEVPSGHAGDCQEACTERPCSVPVPEWGLGEIKRVSLDRTVR